MRGCALITKLATKPMPPFARAILIGIADAGPTRNTVSGYGYSTWNAEKTQTILNGIGNTIVSGTQSGRPLAC